MLAVAVAFLLRLAAWLAAVFGPRSPSAYRRTLPLAAYPGRARKPAWVRREVVRLKALMREDGTCRAIADVFNRRFGAAKNMTVGKTFVANAIRAHRHDIVAMRREMRRARPRPMPRNLVWATDLTGKSTLDGKTHAILGILEHASRAALRLEALQSKSSCAGRRPCAGYTPLRQAAHPAHRQ